MKINNIKQYIVNFKDRNKLYNSPSIFSTTNLVEDLFPVMEDARRRNSMHIVRRIY